MTARSTRNKMRHQAEKVMNDLDRCAGHLKFLSELSGGESKYVENYIGTLVVFLETMKQTVKSFREGL
ncbi:hypothetical protein ES703_08489 [subsurface metagenome]